MKKIQMIDVMRLLAEHKEAEARDLMKQLIIQESREINERFMAEELESELSIGDELEAELGEVDPELDDLSDEIDSEVIMDDGAEELEDLEGSDIVDELEDRVESVEDAIEALRAEFEELMGSEESDEIEPEESELDAELDAEESESELDAELDAEDADIEADIEEIQDEEQQ